MSSILQIPVLNSCHINSTFLHFPTHWIVMNLYFAGTLAEKALLAVMPPEDNCPYTVRINSEVMASDGSTSMASVCAGCARDC